MSDCRFLEFKSEKEQRSSHNLQSRACNVYSRMISIVSPVFRSVYRRTFRSRELVPRSITRGPEYEVAVGREEGRLVDAYSMGPVYRDELSRSFPRDAL